MHSFLNVNIHHVFIGMKWVSSGTGGSRPLFSILYLRVCMGRIFGIQLFRHTVHFCVTNGPAADGGGG